jgi:hypothetical protein
MLNEIDEKLNALKSKAIVVEELSVSDRIRNCPTLVDIFGGDFCDELADLHED